ncbi:protein of unknown function (DUF4129) [Promicromonospora umidemergens]|uniref:Protein-glutamine gamma-glutamyltransferase-like C-terminal domain-containing protein n=1 Tax=Promicromonospora umidemergens TaxID=629679 RepID=A0ABP8XN76_9MICO|nr:DUF4129 domain-containing protein [Promicromonospora umidemergens]MCP2281968.1 protein of unknown function (DUF4129) [Promicromonospora umidemergens]
MTPTTRLTSTLLLLTVVVLGVATATPWRFNPPQLATTEPPVPEQLLPAQTSSPSPLAAPPTSPPADIRWLGIIAAILLGLLIATILTLAIRKLLALHRARTTTTPDKLTGGTTTTGTLADDVDLPELQDAVSRALAHLDGHARPRDAVVAAWVALEDAAARAGAHRNPAQTPTEFAGAVLATTPAPPTSVARLRTLYQRARFTDRPIDRTTVNHAREALADIARSLDVDDLTPDDETPRDTPRQENT